MASGSGKVYLYDAGNECTSLTGGWGTVSAYFPTGTLTKQSDHLYLKASPEGASGCCPSFYTLNKIPFSLYSKLCIEFAMNKADTYPRPILKVIDTAPLTPYNYTYDTGFTTMVSYGSYAVVTIARSVAKFDLVSVANNYLYIDSKANSSGYPNETFVYSIWLE